MTQEEEKRLTNQLSTEFEGRWYRNKAGFVGTRTLHPDDAIDFIRRGRELGLDLWGVEGAEIQPNGQLQFGTLQYETSLGLDPYPKDMPQDGFVEQTIAAIRSAPAEKWVFEVCIGF